MSRFWNEDFGEILSSSFERKSKENNGDEKFIGKYASSGAQSGVAQYRQMKTKEWLKHPGALPFEYKLITLNQGMRINIFIATMSREL